MSNRRAQVCLLLTTIAFSSLSFAAQADRIQGSVFGGGSVKLAGSVNRKALPQYDRGPADPTTEFTTITLLTTPTAAQQKALQQLLADQQNRQSANYHKWLTPEQWADRFGLSQNDIQQITSWLRSEGFTVTTVARGRNWILFRGTAAQVESAFGTAIHRFYVNGEWHVANATAPKIPAALGGIATGIRGLDDFYPRPRAKVRPNYYDSTYGFQVAAPGDIATIYDINDLYNASTPIDGTGQKLAVVGQTDIYLSDITDFRTSFGLSAISCTTNSSGVITACSDPHLQYVIADGMSDPGVPLTGGDLSEADLDLEMSGAVARGAQLIFVNAPTNGSGGNPAGGGVWNAWYWAVDNDLAPVISMSYGVCEFGDNDIIDPSTGQFAADEIELQKANSLGITFVNSAGDSGAAECDPTVGTTTPADPSGFSATQGLALSYPASSPEVTGVGGTATPLADFGSPYWGTSNGTGGASALEYVPEQAWNDDEELAQYCASNSSNPFCTQGGTQPMGGWQPVGATTANASKVMQEDLSLFGSGISSTGGGASNCATQNTSFSACVSGFPQPSWQTVTISGQSSVRFSPDVSFLASPDYPGYIFCTELSELGISGTGSSCASGIQNAIENDNSIIGGTSASTPLFAGMVVLLNQYLGSSGLGNVNPTLYQLAASSSNGAFNRVNTGDNLVYCTPGDPGSPQPSSLDCPSAGVFGFEADTTDSSNGFDLVTGLGSVNANHLAKAWAAAVPADFTLTPTAASFQVAQGSSVNATVTLALANGFTGTVTFTCSDPATASICTVPQATNASGQVSFNITTALPTSELRPLLNHGSGIFYAMLLPGLVGLVLTAGSRKRSLRGMRFLGLLIALGFSTLWLSSCGGGSSGNSGSPGTPTGTYTITVTGTSGGATSNASFNLVVQ